MNIFDQGYPSLGGESDEEAFMNMYRAQLAPQQPQNIMDGAGGVTGPEGLTQNMPGFGENPNGTPAPTMDSPYAQGADVSGFANYGMSAPDLNDPMAQLKMMMGMSAEPKRPPPQAPQGNLMAYLQQLGVI